jgi:paraquat-inducible protein B
MAGSGNSSMTDPDRDDPSRQPQPSATFKRSRWPGLIWAAPLAAVLIVGWLGLKAYLSSGPEVHVVFPLAGGLKPGHTKVKYKGLTVGNVSSVKIDKSLRTMKVALTFHAVMKKHLAKGTRFWIAGHSVSLGNLSSLKALISGPFIGMDPVEGKLTHHFVGLSKPPVLKTEPHGETLTLVTHKLGNVSRGSPIYYRNFKVGEVRGLKMAPSGETFNIYAFISQSYEHLVNARTHFWNAGAVHVSTGGSGPGVQIQSVPALFMGAIAFETPRDQPNIPPPGPKTTYKLYKSEGAARNAPSAHAVPYAVVFQGGPHGLSDGSKVELEGAAAGVVTHVRMDYDPGRGAIYTLVRLVLEPTKINLAKGNSWNMTNPAPQMNAMIDGLVKHGLRAQMGSSVPVVGGKIIQLSEIKGQAQAALESGNPPRIPAMPGGGGANQIMAQVSDILAKINAMPLTKIGDNIHDVTKRVAMLSKSPQTQQTLEHLKQTTTHIDAISATTSRQLPSILFQVHKSAIDAQAALNSARQLLASQGGAGSNPESGSLPQAIYELTRAARSLRELTDYLGSHPNSILFGKGR